ncbi:MAG: tyrosine--tRNA ligase [Patescibacteria group bacterium]|nr:tyrosine--tRNA ligase [Patescibacteria group bacterium]
MKSSRKSKANDVEEILTRGVTEVIDREHLRKALLSGKKLRVKLGIDPTGPRIHLGRAVLLRKLRAFQDLGHRVVLIVGDFTAQIGDPSDKLAKRPLLTPAQVAENMKNYKKQLGKIIDLKTAEVKYNSSWLSRLNFTQVTRLAESFSVQQMLARRNFKERYEKGIDISLREFLYPLMQGYDSVAVKADVEIGGFDQLFNLMAGRAVQKYYGKKEQDILTCEMLEGTDGRKMSTSWGNVINITDEPNDMFGKLMSVRDGLIGRYLLLTTDVSREEINAIESGMQTGKVNPRDAKLRLAREVVAIYHGEKSASAAETEFLNVFQKGRLPANVREEKIQASRLSIVDLLVQTRLAASKSSAFRLIQQGGVKVDGEKISDPKTVIVIPGKTALVVQAGKRDFLKVSRR